MCLIPAVLQEADLAQADKYAEVAMTADRYNPSGTHSLTTLQVSDKTIISLFLTRDL